MNDIKLLERRVIKLSQLLREYEGSLNNWTKIDLRFVPIEDSMERETHNAEQLFVISFYKHVVKDIDGKPVAFRNSTEREFLFTITEMDKAIARYRMKVVREKEKQLSE